MLTRIDLRSPRNVRDLFSSGLPLLENLELDSTGLCFSFTSIVQKWKFPIIFIRVTITLILANSKGITDEGIGILSKSCHNVQRNVRYLLVGSHEPNDLPSISDEALKHIGTVHTLNALDIAYQSSITATGIRNALVGIPRLKFLNLDATGMNDVQ